MNRCALRVLAGFGLIAISAAASPASATTCSSVSACVFGTNASSGAGVQGKSSKGDGVDGSTSYASTAAANAKAGMYGLDASSSHYNYGVFGSSSYGTGVHGTTSSGTGISAAATSTSGIALTVTAPRKPVVIKLTGTEGTGISVDDNHDATSDVSNTGIFAQTVGTALIARSERLYGVIATGLLDGSGLLAEYDKGTGVDINGGGNGQGLALNITAYGGGPMIVGGDDAGHTWFDADSNGNLTIAGTFVAEGGIGSSTARADGTRVATYSPRDAEPVVENVGETRIVNGAASVALDPAFAATLDPTRPYYVFLTPEGDNRGLYVGTRTMRGFTIRESSSGRSALGVQYRIVGKPLGARERRLAALDATWRLQAGRLRAAAALKRKQTIAPHLDASSGSR